MRPSKPFLKQHCRALERLPTSTFQKFGRTTFHVDGGANCNGTNDIRSLYFYIPTPSHIEHVGGDKLTTPGWGGQLVRYNNTVHLLAPVYFCPQNPRNTLSTTSLIQYCGYSNNIINTNKSMTFTDTCNRQQTIEFKVYNDLDHIEVDIMTFNPHPCPIIASAAAPRRSPRLHMNLNPISDTTKTKITPQIDSSPKITKSTIPTTIQFTTETYTPPTTPFDIFLNNEYITSISRNAMSQIAAFTVMLESDASPRTEAIKLMNSIMDNSLPPIPTKLLQAKPNEVKETLIPVIAKFSRNINQLIPPQQEWMKMHFGLLHASKTSMDPIIKRDLLSDIPPTLKKIHTLNCTCTICARTKTNKLPRGKDVDKSKLKPFNRLHLDFAFYGVTSIRGFTAALDITCGATSYAFGFPTKAKTPPLDIVQWSINTIRTMGYEVIFIRVDEDSSLANSSEFCSLIKKLNCLLETTGGGNSTNNGMVETGNRSRANMVRSSLATMDIMFGNELPKEISIDQF